MKIIQIFKSLFYVAKRNLWWFLGFTEPMELTFLNSKTTQPITYTFLDRGSHIYIFNGLHFHARTNNVNDLQFALAMLNGKRNKNHIDLLNELINNPRG